MKCLVCKSVEGKLTQQNRKLENLKNFYLKAKKHTSSKCLDPKKLIRKAMVNMNNVRSQKYSYPPEAVEKNAVKYKKFREIYDFYRLLQNGKYVQT